MKMHGGGTLGWLLFITAEPHSLDRGGGQHRGRWTGTWLRGLLLAEPPPIVSSHPCDGDEAVTKMRKAMLEKGIEDRRWGKAFRFGCANDTMINNHPSPMKGRARSIRMKNSLLFPF
jgi:hypothetical protein